MVYPQRAVSVLQGIGTVTPLGRRKVNRFVADCLTPELTDNPAKLTRSLKARISGQPSRLAVG